MGGWREGNNDFPGEHGTESEDTPKAFWSAEAPRMEPVEDRLDETLALQLSQ